MCLFDRIAFIVSVVFLVLGVINGFRLQVVSLVCIIACALGVLALQEWMLTWMIRHLTHEPVFHFIGFFALFMVPFFVLKSTVISLTSSNKSGGSSSWWSLIAGGFIGVINVWLLALACFSVSMRHSSTRSMAKQLFNNSHFINLPLKTLQTLQEYVKIKSVKKQVRDCARSVSKEPS